MALPTPFSLTNGYVLLFVWVLLEQLGSAACHAGASCGAGRSRRRPINFFLGFRWPVGRPLSSPTASGFRRPQPWAPCSAPAVQTLARAHHLRAPHPGLFGRRRGAMLMFAKFVPGLGILAPPVAGQNGMSYGAFLFFDGMGATLWVGTLLGAGRFFGDLLERNPQLLSWVGRSQGIAPARHRGVFPGRVSTPSRVLRKLVGARLEPAELKRQLDAGEAGVHRRPAPSAGTHA